MLTLTWHGCLHFAVCREVPNAQAKSELRPTAQIAKERVKKAKIKGRLKALQNKKRRK